VRSSRTSVRNHDQGDISLEPRKEFPNILIARSLCALELGSDTGKGRVECPGFDRKILAADHRRPEVFTQPNSLAWLKIQNIDEGNRIEPVVKDDLETGAVSGSSLRHANELAAIDDDLTGADAAKTHQARPAAVERSSLMCLRVDAKIAERRNEHVPKPPKRDADISVPAWIVGPDCDIDPMRVDGIEPHGSPTAVSDDDVDMGTRSPALAHNIDTLGASESNCGASNAQAIPSRNCACLELPGVQTLPRPSRMNDSEPSAVAHVIKRFPEAHLPPAGTFSTPKGHSGPTSTPMTSPRGPAVQC